MIALYFLVALIVGWLIYRAIYLKRKQRQYLTAFNETFENSAVHMPRLKTGYSYSFPSFEVTFENEEELKLAESGGLTEQFENRIQKIHTDIKDFDAKQAIYFTWKGRTYNIISPA